MMLQAFHGVFYFERTRLFVTLSTCLRNVAILTELPANPIKPVIIVHDFVATIFRIESNEPFLADKFDDISASSC